MNRIRGILSPVVTPFTADLSPDVARFKAHCEWLLSRDCGLAIFGTNSEGNSLSLAERLVLVDMLVDGGLDATRMMPGTGACSLGETVQLTRHVTKRGCAGVLMLPPFYYKGVTEEGLFRYFSEVIQRVGDTNLRVYLYHIPPVAVVGITTGLVERLLKEYPTAIAGMKDSSGDWNNTKSFIEAFSSSGYDVFAGSESFLLQNLRAGGVGCITATANVNPAAIHQLYATWHQDDSAAEAQQKRLNEVRDAVGRNRLMIAALKQTIAQFTNDPGWGRVRPPLVELTAEQSAALAEDLAAVGFTMDGVNG